jgi:exopolyphosphatase/guanosine-5'-triphosphate,3'-diphosphate pyrophosphatase
LLTPVLNTVPNNLKTVVAVGGTATTVAAMLQQLTVYQLEKVHLFTVTSQRLQDLWQRVSKLTLTERRQLPGLQPERADIIPAGMAIIISALEILKISSFIVSEADILWGLALMAATDVDKKSVVSLS